MSEIEQLSDLTRHLRLTLGNISGSYGSACCEVTFLYSDDVSSVFYCYFTVLLNLF